MAGPRKKFDDIFSRVDTMHQRDRRTDRRTDTGRQQRPRLRIASRGKNDNANCLLVELPRSSAVRHAIVGYIARIGRTRRPWCIAAAFSQPSLVANLTCYLLITLRHRVNSQVLPATTSTSTLTECVNEPMILPEQRDVRPSSVATVLHVFIVSKIHP